MDVNEKKDDLWRAFFLISISFLLMFLSEKGSLNLRWDIGLNALGLYSFYLALMEVSSFSQGIRFPNLWKVAVVLVGCMSIVNVTRILMFSENVQAFVHLIEEFFRILSNFLIERGSSI